MEALAVLARSQIAMGRGAEALVALRRLQSPNARPGDFALLRAEALLQQGDVKGARKALGATRSADAWRLRALAAVLQNRPEVAAAAFAQGAKADGDKGRLFAAEASWHLAKGRLAEAGTAVANAQRVAPERIETLFTAARLAEARGDELLALSNYLRITEKVPADRPALLAAIGAAERSGRPKISRHLIAYGFSKWPDDREFIYQRARVEAWDGDWPAVRSRLQANEPKLRDHAPARLLYAEALLNLGQIELARALVVPIHTRNPSDAQAKSLYERIASAS